MESVDVFIGTGESKNKAFSNVAIVEQIENNVRCVTPEGSEVTFKDCGITVVDLTNKEVVLQKFTY